MDPTQAVRAAEVIGALSLAADLAMAAPFEHGLRSALIAVRLGRRLGLDEPMLAQIYLVALLYYVGCTADLDVFSRAVGDEKLVRSRMAPVVFDSPAVMGRAMLAGVAAQTSSPLGRVAAVARALPMCGGRCRKSRPGTATWPACSPSGSVWARRSSPCSLSSTNDGTARGCPDTLGVRRFRFRFGSPRSRGMPTSRHRVAAPGMPPR